MLLPINDLPATVTPMDDAIYIKYIGNDLVSADNASGEILPAKKVSTILYKVWNKVPTLAGIASFLINILTSSDKIFIRIYFLL